MHGHDGDIVRLFGPGGELADGDKHSPGKLLRAEAALVRNNSFKRRSVKKCSSRSIASVTPSVNKKIESPGASCTRPVSYSESGSSPTTTPPGS